MSGNNGINPNFRPNIPMMMNQNFNYQQNPNPSLVFPNPNFGQIPQMVGNSNNSYFNIGYNMPFMNPLMMNAMQALNSMPVINPPVVNAPQKIENKKIWVSHIPPNLSDMFMLKLLESCGPVLSWKRTKDENGRPKGFGFCEYTTVEGLLKALRLLNHLQIEEGYDLSVIIFFILD
jgi:RNA recognition motif-containing protein